MHWAGGHPDAALSDAAAAYRLDAADAETGVLLASLIGEFPGRLPPELRSDLIALLRDPHIAPEFLSVAGWQMLLTAEWWNAAAGDIAALCGRLDGDALALALLTETPVCHREAERVLTMVRRWLLDSERWPDHPHLLQALIVQAALNGGAWPFAAEERATLDSGPAHPMAAAYWPPRQDDAAGHPAGFADPVTQAVAAGYERWPYPMWRRLMRTGVTQRLPDQIRALDPGGPDVLPVQARILIAGCGTGSEAAQVALEYPEAEVAAIDISEASLSHARTRCAALGLERIRFRRVDLHDAASLGERFDAIFCSGVLHHLPDPERGWAALAGVLRPGGVMRIMLYSRAARVWVAEARRLIADLAAVDPTSDVLREVRRRFMDNPQDPRTWPVVHSMPFASLSGTHDLLLHRQEDCFDIPRIGRALERLRMKLLTFHLVQPELRARYETMFPADRLHRDLRALAFFERREPAAFVSQYSFWCRSEAFWFAGGGARR